jgi:WD40 repeat protein
MLLTASWDRTIRLWDIGKRQSAVLLNDLPERVRVIAFVPDGRWVAFVATDGSVQVRALT